MPLEVEKLTAVVAMLRSLPARLNDLCRFSMNDWLWQEEGGQLFPMSDPRPLNECKTAACVAGWTVLLLPELGLTMGTMGPVYTPPGGGGVRYQEYTALAVCFGLPSTNAARELFGWQNPNDPLEMADKIERYVKNEGFPEYKGQE